MSKEKLELQTRRLTEELLGRETRPLLDIQQITQALSSAEVFLIFDSHQWVATEKRDERIHFFTPDVTGERDERLPPHKWENEGEYSVSIEDLAIWLKDNRMRALQLLS